MNRRAWPILLAVFVGTWIFYLALLLPLGHSMLQRISGATHCRDSRVINPAASSTSCEDIIDAQIVHLLRFMPIIAFVIIGTVIVAIRDILRRDTTRKLLWILGFCFLGAVVIPLYYFRVVLRE